MTFGIYKFSTIQYPVMHFEDTDSVYLIGKVISILAPGTYANEKEIEKYIDIHGEDEE